MASVKKKPWMESKWIQNNTRDLKLIGKGGYGSVFSFIETRTKLQKALKVIEFENAEASLGIEIDEKSWFNEARYEIDNLRSLDKCEFILRLEDYHLDYDNNCIYVVTELAKNNLLQHIINSKHNLPLSEIKDIIFSVLNGLYFAHERGIVHRDIKPENILITASGSFLLGDWGIARKMRNSGTHTNNTQPKGTTIYLSPEIHQLVEGDINRVNLYKSDTYSAGLLFLVCCGLLPRKLESIDKWEEQEHNSKLLEHLRNVVLTKVPEFMDLITKLTQFDPKKRFDVGQALKFCIDYKIFSQINSRSIEGIHLDSIEKGNGVVWCIDH